MSDLISNNSIPPLNDFEIAVPVLRRNQINSEFIEQFQNTFYRKTHFNLVYTDRSGNLSSGIPDCQEFPCSESCSCCRERIIEEALRTQNICFDKCHAGYLLWGIPITHQNIPIGGLIVIGAAHSNQFQAQQFIPACEWLIEAAKKFNLIDPNFSSIHTQASIEEQLHSKEFQQLSNDFDSKRKILVHLLLERRFDLAEFTFASLLDQFKKTRFFSLNSLRGLVLIFTSRLYTDLMANFQSNLLHINELSQSLQSISTTQSLKSLEDEFRNSFLKLQNLTLSKPIDNTELRIQKVLTYMEIHLADDITRESVAKACGISTSQLSHSLKEHKGRTFSDLLNQYRIEKASILLSRTAKSLAEIAAETGFCDQSYFSKVFAKYKHTSPSEFRLSYK